MRSTIRAFLVTFIGVVSGIAGLVGFKLVLVQRLLPETQLAVLFIGFFAFYFFVAHILTRAKWERKSRYADALSRLNRGFEEIHYLNRCEATISKEQVITSFQKLCDSLVEVFTLLTNSPCSACIKIFKASSPNVLVFETLCRDKSVSRERTLNDIRSKEQNISHALDKNTAFSKAFHSNKRYFLSNRLPFLDGYDNTSFNLYGRPKGLNPITRMRYWPLPYKSAIVVPITPAKITSTNSDLIGFLCIDSPKMGVFRAEYDVDIMVGVADGIYNTLKRFKDIL